MALIRVPWLRRLVRRHTNQIPEERAASMKQKLSFLYMFLAWNAFGMVAYAAYKGKSNWAVHHGLESESDSPAQNYAKMLKIDKAKVIRISGLQVQEEYDIEKREDKIVRKVAATE